MPERRKGGRTTPKVQRGASGAGGGTASGRYTPPIPREQRISPTWVPVLMFALLGLGVLVIILNYLNLLPGDADNKYLLLGLAFITAGFVTATNFH